MSGTTTTVDDPSRTTSRRLSWVPLLCALIVATGYLVFVVLPYLVNGLFRYPIEDVAAGYHDPKGLWPFDTVLGWVAGLGGLVTLALGPFVVLGAATGAVALLWSGRAVDDARTRATLVGAVVVSICVLGFLASPFGGALVSWFLD